MIGNLKNHVGLILLVVIATLANAQTPTPVQSLSYSTLYTGADGNSHIRDGGSLDLRLPGTAERADGDMYFYTIEGVSSVMLTRLKAGMVEEWHASPQRMFVFGLEGVAEMAASDGTSRLIKPGDMLLLEDTSGKGHRTHVPGDVDYVGLGILISDSAPAFAGAASGAAPWPPDIDPPSDSRLPLITKESLDEERQRIFEAINGGDTNLPRLGPSASSMRSLAAAEPYNVMNRLLRETNAVGRQFFEISTLVPVEFGRALLRGDRRGSPELFPRMVSLFGRRASPFASQLAAESRSYD